LQDSSGTVGPTPQEQALSANASAEFKRYQSKWLPLQDRLSDVISSMGEANSWQRQEAEGKGSTDVAQQFASMNQKRSVSEMDHGINVGSTSYKLGTAASATAEAEAKGAAVNHGNEAIDKAYLSGLTSITKAGEGLAATATQGGALSAEVGSREAISSAQLANADRANTWGMIGTGIGAAAGGIAGSMGPSDASYGFDPSSGIGGGPDFRTSMAPAGTGIGGSSGRE
jgi:hypothetical protein